MTQFTKGRLGNAREWAMTGWGCSGPWTTQAGCNGIFQFCVGVMELRGVSQYAQFSV